MDKLKGWQEEAIRFLSDYLETQGEKLTSKMVQAHLVSKHFSVSPRKVALQLSKWGFPKRFSKIQGKWQHGRLLDRKRVEELMEQLKEEGVKHLPRPIPMHCHICDWDGFALLGKDEELEDGDRIVKKNDPKGKGKLCLCPRCRDPGRRAYLKRDMKINWQGGKVLFWDEYVQSLPIEQRSRYTGQGYHGPGVLEPSKLWRGRIW